MPIDREREYWKPGMTWDKALDDYYRLNDWDLETGYPNRAKLESLGLSWVVNESSELSEALA